VTRTPVVAGQFYSADKQNLFTDLDTMIPQCSNKVEAIGAVVPHAGYMYSGCIAGQTYAKFKPASTYVILGPSHTGCGARFALSEEPWQTPLGMVEIDSDFSQAIINKTGLITQDSRAHAAEHSIEVQVPFIQKTAPTAKIVPMLLQYGTFAEYREIAAAIIFAISQTKGNTVIIASSDMTHYETREITGKKDKLAIQKLLDLDPQGLLNIVEKNDISMCGCIPAAIMLMCANEIGVKNAELIRYADSGDVTGDTNQVVGYAGIVVY